jgi:hypothetical protein
MMDVPHNERAKRAAEFSPGWSERSEAEPRVTTSLESPARVSGRPSIRIAASCCPLRGLGRYRDSGPRVTLAALAHPGLNSAAGCAGSLSIFLSDPQHQPIFLMDLGSISEGGNRVHSF